VFSHATIRSSDARFVVQVHGGAWNIPVALKQPHIDGVRRAHATACEGLAAGRRPLDVVVSALAALEDDPTFDAGTGSFLDEDGRVQLDAAVMEGDGLRAGAVAGIGRFKNPAGIALAVLEKTDHVLLIGEGAERFALSQGFAPVDPRSLVHPREFAGYEAWVRAGKPDARVFFDEEGALSHHDTVGVVIGVRDPTGERFSLYAGASTGGTRGKKAGRVGDVPLVGCGIYADGDGAAVCCTGWGEAFMRAAAAKSVSDRVAGGTHPQAAVEEVLSLIRERTGGRGGIMAIDPRGNLGAAFSTPDMAYAGPGCRHLEI